MSSPRTLRITTSSLSTLPMATGEEDLAGSVREPAIHDLSLAGSRAMLPGR